MKRRSLLKLFGGLPLLTGTGLAARESAARRPVLIQASSLAGFDYHEAGTVWHRLNVGDPLTLVREPGNRHDQRAVGVYWQDHKLGYVPRKDNAAVSQILDRGERLRAHITEIEASPNPWQRVRFEVWLDVHTGGPPQG